MSSAPELVAEAVEEVPNFEAALIRYTIQEEIDNELERRHSRRTNVLSFMASAVITLGFMWYSPDDEASEVLHDGVAVITDFIHDQVAG